jgi:hypothetical protein
VGHDGCPFKSGADLETSESKEAIGCFCCCMFLCCIFKIGVDVDGGTETGMRAEHDLIFSCDVATLEEGFEALGIVAVLLRKVTFSKRCTKLDHGSSGVYKVWIVPPTVYTSAT